MASGRDSQTSDTPMDEKRRNLIRIRRVELARDMEPRQLIHHMADVLTPIDEEEIKAIATRWGQCEKLLDILPRRGEKAFDSFVKALKKVQPFLADLLVDAEMKPRTEEESSAQCQSVPEEIILRGRSARQVFNEALLEGTKQLKRVPIMIVGQGGSGKTSLKKSLKGQPFDPEENSTVMMEVDPSYCKVTTEVWKIVRQKQAADLGNNSSTVQDVSDIVHLIELLRQELGKDDDNQETYATLWDFGGQTVYYATNSLFLTRNAIYFLVYNLSRNPDDKAIPSERQGLFRVVQDTFSNRTNMHYLDFWMSSISCFASQDDGPQMSAASQKLPQKLPPVFFVCTHADKPYKRGNPKDLAREIYGSLREKRSGLHLFADFFVVDNTKAGTAEECQEDINHLKTEVLAVVKELPHVNQSLPKKWFRFEEALEVMRERGLKWIRIGEARQVALDVCNIVNDDVFDTLMALLHDQRIIIHFTDTPELNEMVIIDLQWLIDVFRKVITIVPYESREIQFERLWRKLETTGVLERDLLNHMWNDAERKASESLLALMERFSLLCPWLSSDAGRSSQYLVPSMLMSPPPDDVMRLIASVKIPSLFVKFESGQVPPSLFPRLVVQFLQWFRENWPGQQQPELFLNFAKFYTHPADECSVILLCHTSSIEVAVHRAQLSSDSDNEGFKVKITRKVCNHLKLILQALSQELIWMKNMQFEMSVLCPVCCSTAGTTETCKSHQTKGCRQGKCLHFLSESELHSPTPIICTPAFGTATRVQVSFNHWFELLDEENASASLLGRPRAPVLEVEESALSLPDEVSRSLLSRNIDAKDVVARLLDVLPLEQKSLENLQPETKHFVRNLARVAKEMNRLDVFQFLREITPAGTTGPLLPVHLEVENVPLSKRRELTINLSGGDEWKQVAEALGLTRREIRFLDRSTLNPFEAALNFICRQRSLSVGELYDLLTECGFPMMADLL